MPKLDKKLTDAIAKSISVPSSIDGVVKQEIHWCKETVGFGLRVSSTGHKAYVYQGRIKGDEKVRTLGKAIGGGSITASTAREIFATVSNELALGKDRLEDKRKIKKTELENSFTLAQAFQQYVEEKRSSSGVELAERSKSDYLKMVRAAGINERGVKYKAGLLYPMAHKSLNMITAEDMTHAHESRKLKSKRQADYAMQGLRAVMNWHGVVVALSPLAKTTAGKNRIVIPISKKNPQPIPNEFLGAWWEAATQESVDAERRSSRAGADGLRLMILTGMRPGEIFGNEFKQGLCVKDVSLVTGRLIAVDTKNHLDHTVLLPKYAVEILEKNCVGKKPEDKVFDIVNFYKVIQRINEQASVKISPHKLRHTFSSIAAASPLISEVTLKCMINHISGSGATGYYTASVASDLTKGWQAVENCILEAAKQYRKTKLRRVA